MSGSGTCRSCGRPIVWAVSAHTGKNIPIDPEPRKDGNIRLVATGTRDGRVLFVHVMLKRDARRATQAAFMAAVAS